MLETIIFLACFIGLFYWAAFVPLPEVYTVILQ